MVRRKKLSKKDRLLEGVYKATVLYTMSVAEMGEPGDLDLQEMWEKHLDRAEAARIPERQMRATVKRGISDAKAIHDALAVLPDDALVKLSNKGWSIVGEGLAN